MRPARDSAFLPLSVRPRPLCPVCDAKSDEVGRKDKRPLYRCSDPECGIEWQVMDSRGESKS